MDVREPLQLQRVVESWTHTIADAGTDNHDIDVIDHMNI